MNNYVFVTCDFLLLLKCLFSGSIINALFHSPMMSGPGFLSTSPESRISSISAFITDCKEVVATEHSNEKRLLRRIKTREKEE